MSVHGPEPGRAKPWRATWRDDRQRSRRFETEDQARAFDALPTADKTAFADGGSGDAPTVPAVESPASVELPEVSSPTKRVPGRVIASTRSARAAGGSR